MDAPILSPYIPVFQGDRNLESEPRRVVVVEPIAVRERIAAQLLGVDEETLRTWRKAQKGPPCKKCGGAVVYVLTELRTWASSLPAVVPA